MSNKAFEWMIAFVTGVWPPPPGSDPARQRTWQIWTAAMNLATAAFVAWSLNVFAFVGFTGPYGFAHASEMSEQTRKLKGRMDTQAAQITDIRVSQDDDKIMDTLQRQCKAMKENNSDAADFSTQRVKSLVDQYRDLTGREYHIPTCRELGVPLN